MGKAPRRCNYTLLCPANSAARSSSELIKSLPTSFHSSSVTLSLRALLASIAPAWHVRYVGLAGHPRQPRSEPTSPVHNRGALSHRHHQFRGGAQFVSNMTQSLCMKCALSVYASMATPLHNDMWFKQQCANSSCCNSKSAACVGALQCTQWEC
eukprot:3941653-Amphidinium_carterae.1